MKPVRNNGDSGSKKWGVAAMGGFQPVPHVLLMKQRELDLDSLDMVVLLNLTSYWWFRNQPPFLRTDLIASRAGVTSRTIQRVIRKLQVKGYVRREKWTDAKGDTRPAIFFEGLIRKLEDLTRSDPMLNERLNKALARNANEQQMEVA